MKSIYITFDNEDFEKLQKKKGRLSWKKFILALTKIDRGMRTENGDK